MMLSDLSIRRPVMAWMMMIALMVFGAISFTRLGVGKLPDVDFPVVSVRLTWEGAAPSVMETDVVDVVEEALTSVQGIKDISSTIRQGQATVSIEFELERDIDVAVQEVQTKLSQAQRQLPREIDPPIVTKTNPEDQPIIWITVTSDNMPLRDLMDYAQNTLEDQFATISGVGEIILGGLLERNLRVWIDAEKLKMYELTVEDVVRAIEASHVEIPAGRLETSLIEKNVRAMGEAINVEEFGQIPIEQRGGRPIFKPIFLRDVALIEDGLADLRRISRTNGKQAVGLGIRKQRGVNEAAIGDRIKKKLAAVKNDVPQGMELQMTVDRTRFIKQSIDELKFTLILSALVTSLVCFGFLGSWSATFNVLLAIPTSILGTFIFMHFMGFTLNTFTMLALSLSIGIVVDDAIMVLENIVRFKEKGLSNIEAASQGARQIAPAAVATTLSIMAIFLPVAFMTGIMGKYFYQFGMTLSVAVLISLFEALTFTPMRCSQFLNAGKQASEKLRLMDKLLNGQISFYRQSLSFLLTRRAMVIVGSIIIFALSLKLFPMLKKEFVPAQDQNMFFARLQTPEGSSIELTNERFKLAEQFIISRPEVQTYFSAIGGFGGGEVNSGQIFVILKDPKDRPILEPYKKKPTQKDIMALFRKELNKIPDVTARIQDPSLSGFSSQRGFPVEVTLLGPEREKLIELNDLMQRKMKESGLMVDIDSNHEKGVVEIQIFPDRPQAFAKAVSMDSIAQTINALVAGNRVAKYTQDGRRYDVRVSLLNDQRTKIEDIQNLYVWNNRAELVALKEVIQIKEREVSQSITRRNRQRSINVYANIAPEKSQADAITFVQKTVKEILPAKYTATFGGSTQSFQESFSSLSFVLWLGVLIAYMVLASQFNGYKDPFIILLAMPFSLSGALLALWLTKQSLNLYSFIGLILLMGLVKKNSILLVEFTNQLKENGMTTKDALLEACPVRLRPILMTSISTIVAAIPPAISVGPGAEVLVPMAVTVIGGMLVSTLLTLVVIPCVYSIVKNKPLPVSVGESGGGIHESS